MKTKYAEVEFLKALFKQLGGLPKLSKRLGKDYFTLSNWQVRGYVPSDEMMHVSKTLSISPLILNNRHFHYITDWKKLVKDSRLLPTSILDTILSKPLKYKL